MRRRWVINWMLVLCVEAAWCIGWLFTMVIIYPQAYKMPTWLLLPWFVPPILVAIPLGVLWLWPYRRHLWIARRVAEPVTKDLREKGSDDLGGLGG